jgi:hypothetical protein
MMVIMKNMNRRMLKALLITTATRLWRLADMSKQYLLGALLMLGLGAAYLQHQEDSAFQRLSSAAWEETQSAEAFGKLVSCLSEPLRAQFDRLSAEEREVLLLLAYVARLAHERDLNFGRFTRPNYLPRIGARDHLNDPGGKCASYTIILGKLLRCSGYKVRKVGLTSSKTGQRATHHVLEVWLPEAQDWVLLDTIFSHAFVDADGSLSSAAEVQKDWHQVMQQLPADYDAETFSYVSLYYTNWQRLPGFALVEQLMPGMDAWLQARGVALPFVFQMSGYGFISAVAFCIAALWMMMPWLITWRIPLASFKFQPVHYKVRAVSTASINLLRPMKRLTNRSSPPSIAPAAN